MISTTIASISFFHLLILNGLIIWGDWGNHRLHLISARRHGEVIRPEPGTGIKLTFQDSKGKEIKTIEANEGDDLLSLAHEHDVDLEGELVCVSSEFGEAGRSSAGVMPIWTSRCGLARSDYLIGTHPSLSLGPL